VSDATGRDGALFVYDPRDLPARIDRLDPTTGKRERLREIAPSPAESGGEARIQNVIVTPDGAAYAYNVGGQTSTLYLVDGLR
jgi:hypothetical protein